MQIIYVFRFFVERFGRVEDVYHICNIRLSNLTFPNRYVEIRFAENLLSLYAPSTSTPGSHSILRYSRMTSFKICLEKTTGNLHIVQSLTCCVCFCGRGVGRKIILQRAHDLEILISDFAYVFEFKNNK